MGIIKIFKQINKIINNIDNPVKVDPQRFNDPIAMKTEWSPMPNAGGANFCTSRLIKTDELIVRFQPTAGVILFFASFIIVSIAFPFIFMQPPFEGNMLIIIIPILFMAVGLYGLIVLTAPAVFDKRAGIFYKGRKRPGLNDSKIKKCQLNNVHAIQLLSRLNRSQDSEGMTNTYYSFELNLVMHDGKRINVIAHGNLERIRADAKVLSHFLNIQIWDGIN